MKMKKICIFCSLSSFGTGMPISTYKLAVGLADRGGVGVCVVLPEEGELAERLRGAGVDVGVVPFERVKRDSWKRPWRLFAWVSAGWRLYKYVRGGHVGIVHFSDVIDAPFYPFARIAGAMAVAHVRVCVDAPAVRYLYRVWTHLFCSRIVVVSHFVKRYYKFGRRAAVVYNPGPDREVFDPKRYLKTPDGKSGRGTAGDFIDTNNIINTNADIHNTHSDCPIVAAVSSFRRDKGLHNFVEIAAEIAARLSGARFIIVGGMVKGHEEYYYEVIESARRVGLGERLTVIGNVKHEEVAAHLAGTSVLIHAPDWEEALGGVVLEAMAMGVAVVAYDCGGIGECFHNGISGYLVNRGDKTGAAMRVTSLLNNPKLLEDMTAKAKKELDEKFTQDSYLNGVLAVYDRIWNDKQ
jgi:glycosyltransferase involved in cell wall biosynthesis